MIYVVSTNNVYGRRSTGSRKGKFVSAQNFAFLDYMNLRLETRGFYLEVE